MLGGVGMSDFDDNQGSGSIFGKFRERLWKIKKNRSRNRKSINNEQFVQEKVQEIRKSLGRDEGSYVRMKVGIPEYRVRNVNQRKIQEIHEKRIVSKTLYKPVVEEVIPNQSQVALKKKGKFSVENITSLEHGGPKHFNVEKKSRGNEEKITLVNKNRLDKCPRKVVSGKDKIILEQGSPVVSVKRNVDKISSKKKGYYYQNNKRTVCDGEVEDVALLTDDKRLEYVNWYQDEILLKLKANFCDLQDEIAVIESDLFFVEDKFLREVEVDKLKKLEKEINKIIERINAIIEEYNIYNRNSYMEYYSGLSDFVLADDIISFGRLLDSVDDKKKFVSSYKKLDEYKDLYRNLVSVREDVLQYLEKNEEVISNSASRDKKHSEIQLDADYVSRLNQDLDLELRKQNEYFKELMEKVSRIDRREYVTTHLRGIGNLVGASLRYMGLMALSPFMGILPSIYMNALSTRKMIHNLRQNLKFEDVVHVKYDYQDFDNEICGHIVNVDTTSYLLDGALADVRKLREDLMFIYDSRVLGFDETLKKINQIEENILRNQNRVEIVKRKLIRGREINSNKLRKVRKLEKEVS